MEASSAPSSRSAISAVAGSCTTTVAVVPMARKERAVRTLVRACGRGRHRDVPPDVTDGRLWLMVGAIVVGVTLPPSLEEDGVEVEVVDVEDPDEEDERPDVVVVTDEEPVDPLVRSGELVVAEPGWSRETTMPMATVAPVAAMTAPRVSQRSRDVAFSRSRDPCAV